MGQAAKVTETQTPKSTKHCPKCGSVRVHRSRRSGLGEYLLARLGAEVCRCHDCRSRQAWFGANPIRLPEGGADGSSWRLALGLAGLAGTVLLVWWMVIRYAGLSG
jgi:hypothetical protein